ncbi:18923_t:CDS:2 [Dentiscutata erythropus]|uniref:18923_t:CDS:1 n=1 Tax=Dentiscutata erythropus TaxID=1348616 RepID=A0A9N9BX03_9GLOM|nr:18923_t:CDS:2 [Dentiscutata erythropus]
MAIKQRNGPLGLQSIYNQIFSPIPPKIHEEHLVYTGEDGQDFYFSSTQYKLSQAELKKIKHHFSTISDVSGLQLLSFNQIGTKYGRLRTKDGHYIGSKWNHHNKDWSRTNYNVMIKIEVDILCKLSKVTISI